jgi:hypothetical protein
LTASDDRFLAAIDAIDSVHPKSRSWPVSIWLRITHFHGHERGDGVLPDLLSWVQRA